MEDRNFGLCEGCHEIDGVTEYIFGNTISDPTDTAGLENLCYWTYSSSNCSNQCGKGDRSCCYSLSL